MDHALTKQWAMAEQDQRISEVVKRERSRLRNFIRRRVADPSDVEDILQDVFYRLVEANRLLMPIEHVTGWLFRVARNRITDLFRKHKPENFAHALAEGEEGELLEIEDLLPSPDAGPEAVYVRSLLLDELELALDELPDEHREVFVAHELDGQSFKQMAAETGGTRKIPPRPWRLLGPRGACRFQADDVSAGQAASSALGSHGMN